MEVEDETEEVGGGRGERRWGRVEETGVSGVGEGQEWLGK